MELQVHLPENFPDLLKDAVAAVLRDQLREASDRPDHEQLLAAALAGLGPVRRIIVTTDERVLVFEPQDAEIHELSADEAEPLGSRDGPLARLLPDDERERLLSVLDQIGMKLPTDADRGSQGQLWRPRSSLPRRSGHDRRESVRRLSRGDDERRGDARGA
jgi:hypothetical protein